MANIPIIWIYMWEVINLIFHCIPFPTFTPKIRMFAGGRKEKFVNWPHPPDYWYQRQVMTTLATINVYTHLNGWERIGRKWHWKFIDFNSTHMTFGYICIPNILLSNAYVWKCLLLQGHSLLQTSRYLSLLLLASRALRAQTNGWMDATNSWVTSTIKEGAC